MPIYERNWHRGRYRRRSPSPAHSTWETDHSFSEPEGEIEVDIDIDPQTFSFRPRRSSTPPPRWHRYSFNSSHHTSRVPRRSCLRQSYQTDLNMIYFAFAPGQGFFFDAPNGCEYYNLPSELLEILTRKPLERTNCLAISDSLSWLDPMWYCSFRSDERAWICLNEKLDIRLPRLAAHLSDFGRNSMRVAFGPNESWISWREGGRGNTIAASHNLNQEVLNQLTARYGDYGGERSERIRHVTLGVADAFMIIWANGELTGQLFGQYDNLLAALSGLGNRDVLFLALSPWNAGDFFLLLDSGKVIFQVPRSHEGTLTDICRRHGLRANALRRSRSWRRESYGRWREDDY